MIARTVSVLLVVAAACTLVAAVSSTKAAPVAKEGTYAVDVQHSMVIFKILHVNVANFYGRFNTMSGEIVLDGKDSRMVIAVETASIDTAAEGRDKHMKSPQFFDAEKYPQMTFKSTKVRKSKNGYEAQGDLTLRGVTKSISLEIEEIGAGDTFFGNYRAGFETKLKIKRSDFGMDAMLDKLGDEVELIISIEGIRAKDEQ